MVLISPVISAEVETINPVLSSSVRLITVPFTIPVGPNQKITFARVFARIDILENDLTGRLAKVFFNNREIGSFIWDIGEGEPFILDKQVSLAGVKENEENEITIAIEQKFNIFGSVRWSLFADFFYTLIDKTTEQEVEVPDEAPVLGEPEDVMVEEPVGFDFVDFLFGDTKKTVRTLAIGVGVVVGVIALTQVASIARTVKR